jgi:hypothetical protein
MNSPPLLRGRRHWLAAACGLAVVPWSAAAEAELPRPVSLAASLQAALRLRQALVVMVSLDGCPFCRIVRQSHLAPLHAQGQPVVQLDIQHADPVRDFGDLPSTHDRVIRTWGVKVTPTVLFFGPGGREVAERLEGASIPDFYGAYLDERLATARRAVAG